MNEMRELTDAEFAVVAAAGVGKILLTGVEVAVAGAIIAGAAGFFLGAGIGLSTGFLATKGDPLSIARAALESGHSRAA